MIDPVIRPSDPPAKFIKVRLDRRGDLIESDELHIVTLNTDDIRAYRARRTRDGQIFGSVITWRDPNRPHTYITAPPEALDYMLGAVDLSQFPEITVDDREEIVP